MATKLQQLCKCEQPHEWPNGSAQVYVQIGKKIYVDYAIIRAAKSTKQYSFVCIRSPCPAIVQFAYENINWKRARFAEVCYCSELCRKVCTGLLNYVFFATECRGILNTPRNYTPCLSFYPWPNKVNKRRNTRLPRYESKLFVPVDRHSNKYNIFMYIKN